MPRRQKQLLFSVSGLLGFSCALTAAVAAGLPLWLRGTVLCRTGAELVNATGPELEQFLGELSYGLFHGQMVKQCGLGGRPSRFSCEWFCSGSAQVLRVHDQVLACSGLAFCSSCSSATPEPELGPGMWAPLPVFPDLLGAVPAGLHVSVIFFCSVVVLFSSVASGFFFFNAFGRPYEMLQGPAGLYLWTCICCVSSCLVLVLFSCEVKLHRLSERISNFREENFEFQTFREDYGRCFWLFFLVFVLHGLNALLIRLVAVQLPLQENKEVTLGGGASDLMY